LFGRFRGISCGRSPCSFPIFPEFPSTFFFFFFSKCRFSPPSCSVSFWLFPHLLFPSPSAGPPSFSGFCCVPIRCSAFHWDVECVGGPFPPFPPLVSRLPLPFSDVGRFFLKNCPSPLDGLPYYSFLLLFGFSSLLGAFLSFERLRFVTLSFFLCPLFLRRGRVLGPQTIFFFSLPVRSFAGWRPPPLQLSFLLFPPGWWTPPSLLFSPPY